MRACLTSANIREDAKTRGNAVCYPLLSDDMSKRGGI